MVDRARVRVVANLLNGAVLFGVLTLPTLDSLLTLDHTPQPQEKRALASRPGLPRSLGAIADFPSAFDRYLDDHFGFRSLLIRLHARITVCWLGVSPGPNVDVVVGRHGWLYYTGDIEGKNPFSESDLKAWHRVLRERDDWLARRGIRYLVVFAPSSPSIYPEHLPRWVDASSHGTRLGQLLGELKTDPGLACPDLRRVLVRDKRYALLYSLADTHWNLLGAWAAYDAIMKPVAQWYPRVHSVPFSDFNVAWGRGPGGDLAAMADVQGLISEPIVWVVPKSGTHFRTLPSGDYASLRPWPSGQEPVVTASDRGEIPRAVVFRDSFAVALIPFLSEHFGRAVYLWTTDFDVSVIEREKPDLVIQEYAERQLSAVKAANPPAVAVGRTVAPPG